ncbi:GNAT family N-acetyltransferase [Nocardioides yefusunii]|uniref:GNAT family N-acetyltransferase n=1 Tax=Nocardioides yefusunii TaxID=2500546 RepID=A0ABW1QX91_9ACTN|nr:GNAT family protein [Nocardioides yefusunii]
MFGRGKSRPRPWPVVLRDGDLTVRPIAFGDQEQWTALRAASAEWLRPWEATVPPGAHDAPASFRELVQRLHRGARLGTTLPFVLEAEGRFAGQVTVSNVVRGSAQFGSVGYWVGHEFAGRGFAPRAVALVMDHCFMTVGLHRLEVCVRPENTNSLRVVEKLDLHEVGYAPGYLHIDGDWRDHRVYAATREHFPEGVLAHLKTHLSRE